MRNYDRRKGNKMKIKKEKLNELLDLGFEKKGDTYFKSLVNDDYCSIVIYVDKDRDISAEMEFGTDKWFAHNRYYEPMYDADVIDDYWTEIPLDLLFEFYEKGMIENVK